MSEIDSILRVNSNWLSILSQFHSNILEYRIFEKYSILRVNSNWLSISSQFQVEFYFHQWLNFLGQNDSLFSFSVSHKKKTLIRALQQWRSKKLAIGTVLATFGLLVYSDIGGHIIISENVYRSSIFFQIHEYCMLHWLDRQNVYFTAKRITS